MYLEDSPTGALGVKYELEADPIDHTIEPSIEEGELARCGVVEEPEADDLAGGGRRAGNCQSQQQKGERGNTPRGHLANATPLHDEGAPGRESSFLRDGAALLVRAGRKRAGTTTAPTRIDPRSDRGRRCLRCLGSHAG